MVLVYHGGPYAGQDDYLILLPNLISVAGGMGHYRRTTKTDAAGRVIYEWVGAEAAPHRVGRARLAG
jgi:hypothetical protein